MAVQAARQAGVPMNGSRAWQRARSSIAVVTAGALIAALLPGVPADAAGGRAAAGRPAYHPPYYRGKLWSPRKLATMPSVGGHPLAANAGKRALAALKPP